MLHHREFHNQYGVLGGKAHQGHQPDLEVDVVGESYQPGGQQGAEQGERYGCDHRKRQAPAFVLGCQDEEDHHNTEAERHACATGRGLLLIGGTGPLQLGIVAKGAVGHLFQCGDRLTRTVAGCRLCHDLGCLEDVETLYQLGASGITDRH